MGYALVSARVTPGDLLPSGTVLNLPSPTTADARSPMKIAIALLALACGGCSMGQPASLAPASRQAIAPVQTFGFNPVVRQGIGIPVGAAKCVTGFVTRGLTDAVQTLDCVLDALIPIVTPPQSVIQTAPQSAPCGPVAPTYAPAPRSTPPCEPVATCANGNCAR